MLQKSTGKQYWYCFAIHNCDGTDVNIYVGISILVINIILDYNRAHQCTGETDLHAISGELL